MKIFLTIAFTAALTLAVQAAPSAPKATTPTVESQTFPNYWDAKAWDREGGSRFWTAKEDSKKSATRREAQKPEKKSSGQRG